MTNIDWGAPMDDIKKQIKEGPMDRCECGSYAINPNQHGRDKKALQEIQEILSAKEWDSDTPTHIAEVMNLAGYEIKDITDLDEEEE